MAISNFTQDELDQIYAFAVDLGRKAGDMLMERIEQRISGSEGHSQKFEEKDSSVDIVTQTDEGKLRMSLKCGEALAAKQELRLMKP